ncbi:MAG: HEAT repeat domain-containing protein [Acidobacteriota bacterium]|jgi:HEAT repeat protein
MRLFDALFTPNIARLKDRGNLEKLIRILKHHTDPRVRAQAARALGRPGNTKATEHLMDVALNDDSEDAPVAAAAALGAIGDDSAIGALSTVLKGQREDVRMAAAATLAAIGNEAAIGCLSSALKDEHQPVRARAADALGNIKDIRAVEPLILALRDEDTYVQEFACFALEKIAKPAVGPLTAALQIDDWHVRWLATRILGNIGDSTSIAPLERLLHEWSGTYPKGDMRPQCVRDALARIKGERREKIRYFER